MCAHHLVDPVACTPASGWEKGQVENQVGLIRERFFTPRLRVKAYDELNAWLTDKCVAYAKVHPHPERPEQTVWEVIARWSPSHGGSSPGQALAAVLTDGLPAVEAACAQATSEGVHSSDVIINILARQRDPGPAATILAPDALRLRHAPAADCARYDQLRST